MQRNYVHQTYLDSFKCIRCFKGVGGNTIFAFQEEEEKKEEEILI